MIKNKYGEKVYYTTPSGCHSPEWQNQQIGESKADYFDRIWVHIDEDTFVNRGTEEIVKKGAIGGKYYTIMEGKNRFNEYPRTERVNSIVGSFMEGTDMDEKKSENNNGHYDSVEFPLCGGSVWDRSGWSFGMFENHTHKVRIHRINKGNPLPSQANPGDAGWDVYCSKTTTFKPGEKKAVPLGIIVEAPMGYHFKLCIRSSVAFKRGFKLVNNVGIIDHLYSGPEDEVKMLLEAPSNFFEEVILEEGERLGQLLLEKNENIVWEEQEDRDFNKTSRGGIGSSGV